MQSQNCKKKNKITHNISTEDILNNALDYYLRGVRWLASGQYDLKQADRNGLKVHFCGCWKGINNQERASCASHKVGLTLMGFSGNITNAIGEHFIATLYYKIFTLQVTKVHRASKLWFVWNKFCSATNTLKGSVCHVPYWCWEVVHRVTFSQKTWHGYILWNWCTGLTLKDN